MSYFVGVLIGMVLYISVMAILTLINKKKKKKNDKLNQVTDDDNIEQ